MAWWRAYDEALDDPKLQRLDPSLFKTWFNLLCLANRHKGVLPDPETIAFALRTTPEEFGPKLKALAAAGLFDRADGKWIPHNWRGRQYRSDVSTDRVKQFRERQVKRDETVSGNAPDTETDPEAETEQIVSARKRTSKTPIDPAWEASADLLSYAKAQGCPDPADTFERFKLHHLSKGTQHKDWDSAAQYWCRNEKQFRRSTAPVANDPWAGVDI
jgi:hypothetical protein